jgi:CubicO group peptidase (beta-lactamase class C family)
MTLHRRPAPDVPTGAFRTGRFLAIAIASIVVVSACSGDDGGADENAAATTVPATSAPPATESPATTTTVTAPPVTEPPSTSVPPTSPPATQPPTTAPDETADDLEGSGRYPAQPADVPWPTDGWATAEAPAGIDVAAIDEVVDVAFDAPDNAASVRAILAVHGGEIVYERYHPLDSAASVFDSYSVAKSVTSTLIGMAVRDGLVEVDAPTGLEEWSGDERASITVDDLLRMSSGLEWAEVYDAGGDPRVMLGSPNFASVPIAKPLVDEPGRTFNYSTGTSAILTELLARELGGGDALDDYITTRLIEPLGMADVDLLRDDTGVFAGGLGFNATTRDFARFGLLNLRGGVWDRERLIDESWIDGARVPSASAGAFGQHWWLLEEPDAFVARGLFGQQVVVVPEYDLVVAINTAPGGDPGPVVQAVLDQFAGLG